MTGPKVAQSQDRVSYKAGSWVANESDEYALEEALLLKKRFGGEVTVISVGSLVSQQVLYLGLAKGADWAIRVDADLADCAMISKALAAAIKTVGYDLVLTGVESSDNMAAQVGVAVAERLGVPFAYGITEVEFRQSQSRVTVTKEVGGGVKEILEIPLPALLCIQTGIAPLRYVPVRSLLQARTKSIRTLTLGEIGIDEREFKKAQQLRILDAFPPKRAHRAEIIEGEPFEIAQVLIKRIREALR